MPQTQIVEVTKPQLVDAALVVGCPLPELDSIVTHGDVAAALVKALDTLTDCDQRLESLRGQLALR